MGKQEKLVRSVFFLFGLVGGSSAVINWSKDNLRAMALVAWCAVRTLLKKYRHPPETGFLRETRFLRSRYFGRWVFLSMSMSMSMSMRNERWR